MQNVLPVRLTDEQRAQLERWSRGGATPFRLVVRSQIVLLAADGHSNRSIARELHTNPITVARWRSRFGLLGLEGIRTEAPRSGSPPPIPKEVIRTILYKTLHERPKGRSHWSTRALARVVGVSHSTVRRVWKTFGIRPNRSRVARLAEESTYRPQRLDVVGVYVNPPQRAIAISFGDEPTKRSPPLNPTSRPWLKDLVTTLNLLDRNPPVHSSQRYVDQEFLTFLRSIDERRSKDESIHLLAESEDSTPSRALTRWLSRHPQVLAQVHAGSAPWRDLVLEWIREVSASRPSDAPPISLPSLRTALERWAREHAESPAHFAWTKD
jgi:transposase-like protein